MMQTLENCITVAPGQHYSHLEAGIGVLGFEFNS